MAACSRPATRSRRTPVRVGAARNGSRCASGSARRTQRSKPAHAGGGPAHRLRGGPLPEPGRVLGARHSDLHGAGERLHPELRLLRHRHRPASGHRPGRAAARGRCSAAHGPEARGGDHGRPRRPARWRGRHRRRDDPPDPAHVARHQHRGADQRPERPRGGHPHRGRGPAGHPEPQRRDGSAPAAAGSAPRPLGPLASRS